MAPSINKVPVAFSRGDGDFRILTRHFALVMQQVGPVDVVLELVGGPTFSSSFRCVKPTGTVVVVGNVSVASVPLPLGRMILQETRVIGSSGATKEDVEEVIQMVLDKKLKPILWKEYPLSRDGVQSAHELLKHKNVFGRVVLRCSL